MHFTLKTKPLKRSDLPGTHAPRKRQAAPMSDHPRAKGPPASRTAAVVRLLRRLTEPARRLRESAAKKPPPGKEKGE
jgi:hypothetical protein